MPGTRKDLERSGLMMDKIKNPQPEMGMMKEEQQLQPVVKMKSRPIADMSSTNTIKTGSIKKLPMREETRPELAKDYEMAKRARKNNPTLNEATTSVKLGVNKAAQKIASITKVKVADKAREIFAPNTTVKRDYADPTRVNLGDGSKLGDKKTVQKLDKDGTVLKTKTKPVVSKKSDGNYKSGYISINKSKRSRFADEGVEGFSNKKTKYRATMDQRDKDLLKGVAGTVGGFVLGVTGINTRNKNKGKRANTRLGI
jgi:hypothetical protein